jgi:outer membrane protein TolC
LALVLALALTWGCSPARYRDRADREAYRIIREKSPAVPGMDPEFSIEAAAPPVSLDGAPEVTEADAALGPDGGGEVGARILSLERALQLAVTNSRTYQNEKEALYLEALGLTLDRHRYTPIFSGGASTTFTQETREVTGASDFSQALGAAGDVIGEIEQLTGTPADLLNQYASIVEQAGAIAGWDNPQTDLVDERSLRGDSSFGVGILLKGGGQIALGLTSNFLRFLTGDARESANSVLTGSFAQPLLRGAGSKVSAERLTQAERNVLYSLREFTRFRQEFTVDICSAYYGVLEQRDAVRNNYRSYVNFQRSFARESAFAQEGRKTQADLGRLEQSLLTNEDSWINSIRQYKENLDRFKVQIGLSTDARVVLDDQELDLLRSSGLSHPDISAEDAVKVALTTRLDLYNEHDRLEDSERRVVVAANALKPGLDLLLQGSVRNTGETDFEDLDFRQGRWNAGVDLDLPLDRKAERNGYRSALIAHERAMRGLTLAEDNIKLQVRADWRNLDQARRNYEVAKKKVELNERRVEEQDLRAELGQVTVLDLVDAQNALTESQNGLTAALVNHTLFRLGFWRDMGILYIKKDGRWEEVTDAYGK